MALNSGSANVTPVFTLWPRIGSAYLTGGNPSLTGTPLGQWIASAGAQGSVISRVEFGAVGTTQSSTINVFLTDTGLLTGQLWRSYPFGIISATVTSTAFFTADTGFGNYAAPYVLPSGWTIRATLSTAGTSGYIRVCLGDF